MKGLAVFEEATDSFIDGLGMRDWAHVAETFEFDREPRGTDHPEQGRKASRWAIPLAHLDRGR